MTPKTALLIPCYNAERYLPSLKRQIERLNPAFDEVLLVDDGSTDRTIEVGKKLGLCIRPLGRNHGPGAARNAAARLSKAEWIHFHDADDEIAPHYLAKVLPLAKEGTDAVLCSCDFLEETTRTPIMRWSFDDMLFSTQPLKGCIRTGVNTPSSLLRRSKFVAIGGFDEEHRCWEDGDMHLRLALAGARFRCISDVLCFGIRHKRGTSGSDLYCHRCRLDFLEKYERVAPPIPREDLINEAVATAGRLYREADRTNVDRALDLACRLGWKGPKSKQPAIKALAKLPSKRVRKLLFRLQMKLRGGAALAAAEK